MWGEVRSWAWSVGGRGNPTEHAECSSNAGQCVCMYYLGGEIESLQEAAVEAPSLNSKVRKGPHWKGQ